MKLLFTHAQVKILSSFLSQMAVVWFAASFIGIKDFVFMFQYAIAGFLSLGIALRLVKEVD